MKIIEKVFNAQTGEETIIERDETLSEKQAREKSFSERAAEIAQLKSRLNARQAILEKLGLTEDEAKLLLS